MYTAYTIISFLLGAIFGSFLKVVADRHNTGMTLNGRSECFLCKKTLEWYELIPVVSFIIQRGRCRKCKSRYSLSYLAIEILTGFLFMRIFLKLGVSLEAVLVAIAVSLLVIILLYDLRHTIIPNKFAYSFDAVAFLLLFVSLNSFVIPEQLLKALLAGPLVTLPLFLLWWLSKGKWMGLGDSKLVLGLGWLLGLEQGFSALILSFWIGAGVSLVILLLQKIWGKGSLKVGTRRLTIKSEIPFAPFLIAGFLLTYFFSITVFIG